MRRLGVYRAADDRGIAAKAAHPEAVPQHDLGSRARRVLVGGVEHLAHKRPAAEHVEKVGRYHGAADHFVLAVEAHPHFRTGCHGNALQRGGTIAHVAIVRIRDRLVRPTESLSFGHDDRQRLECWC